LRHAVESIREMEASLQFEDGVQYLADFSLPPDCIRVTSQDGKIDSIMRLEVDPLTGETTAKPVEQPAG
jgi:hypothetical protein